MGEDARAPRLTENSPRKAGLSFDSVLRGIVGAAEYSPVFIKDMPQFTRHLWTPEFLDLFQHSFLIRDPAKVLSSLQHSYRKSGCREGFTADEIGFEQQQQLFDMLTHQRGQPPVVIDSDDLLKDPDLMVELYCNAMGIPFIAQALSWSPGDRSEVLWYDADGSIWHETLRNSDGLKAQPRASVDINDLPTLMQQLYELFWPHYQHLHQFRLR